MRYKSKKSAFALFILIGLFLFAPAYSIDAAAGGAQTGSHDSRLSELDIAPGIISPAFSPDILEYTSNLDAGVTEVSVRAVPRAQGGTIASVEGARSLVPGVNTIKVTSSAPDNSYTVYSITVTVGSTGMSAQPEDEDPDNSAQDGQQNEPSGSGAGEQGAAAPAASLNKFTAPIAADGTVMLNGAAYKLSNNFSYRYITQDIPSAFVRGSLQIDGNRYSTLYCEANGIHLVYMENTDGGGSAGFYYYDEKQNVVERFKYIGTDKDFVVFINSPRADVPDGYTKKELTLRSGKNVAAYKDKMSQQRKDFYLVYGIYSDGSDGWYYYDKKQGTYMRYVEAETPVPEEVKSDEPIERTVPLNKYNLQVEKYNQLKSNMVKAVSVLVIAMLVLIIIFTAVLFRKKDAAEEARHAGGEPKRRKKNLKKMQNAKEEMDKNSLEAGRILDRESAGPETAKITKKILSKPDADGKDRASTPEEKRPQKNESGKEPYAGRTESMQIAAEMMRQSVQYANKGAEASEEAAHDPMDEWEVEASSAKRKVRKKKRSYEEEDIKIMDLNDL